MRRFGWSVGVVMLILGSAIGAVTAAVWISVITHPAPGNLPKNVGLFTAGWVVRMLIGLVLFRRCR